jgi:hypothetical protein
VDKGGKGMPLYIPKVCVYFGGMKLSDAVSHFGTQQKLADALGIQQGSISSWNRKQIPMARALQIERLTGGKLKTDLSKYRRQPSQ